RPTTDADFLINVLSYEHSVMRVRNDLVTLDFTIRQGSLSQYTTRMVRGNQTVDLLVDNHLSPRQQRRAFLGTSRMLGMPGSRKALQRHMQVALAFNNERSTIIEVPDLLGALLMKIASWREAPQGNIDRHLVDAATLASLIDSPEQELLRLNNASDSDRKNVRTLHQVLSDPTDYWWRNMPEEQRNNGLRTVEILSLLIEMPRKADMRMWLDEHYGPL
ncbi:hypothetical protein, partial [uncultured Bifidobacterium sp.]|uniref:hypothetical protein n=1 Tax=uncultured Bifidobacterium sp. TaxID=165187 RepID=UPI00262AF6FB